MITLILEIVSLLFGSGVLVAVWRHFIKRIRANDQKTDAVCLGVQALLRDRMIEQYNHYMEKKYAPIYAKQNFENLWEQYHSLGANGVMDEIHEKFKELPTEPKTD